MSTRRENNRYRHLPAAAALAVAFFFLSGVWLLYRSERERLLQKERIDVLHRLSNISTRIEAGLLTRTDITGHLAAQVAANPGIGLAQFREISRELVSRHTGIRSILLARNSVVSQVYPPAEGKTLLGLRIPDLPRLSGLVRRAIEARRAFIVGPLDSAGEGTAFTCYAPIYVFPSQGAHRLRYWGLAAVSIHRETLFSEAGLNQKTLDLSVAIRWKDGTDGASRVFFGDPALFSLNPVTEDVTVPGGAWQMAAVSKDGRGKMPHQLFLLWLVGGLLSGTAGGLVFLAAQKPRQMAELIARYRQVEQSLRASEEKYRAVVDNANEGIAVAQDGYFRFVNPNLVSLFGYNKEKLLSTPFDNFLHPDDRDLVLERHRLRILGEALPAVYTFRAVNSSGEIKWLEINAVLINWEGRPAALTFLSDITKRKQAEDALERSMNELEQKVAERTAEFRRINEQLQTEINERKKIEQELTISESHFRSLLENAGQAVVYRLAADHAAPHRARVFLISPSVRDILGLDDPHDFETWFRYVHPDDRERVTEANRMSWSPGGRPFNMQFRWWNQKLREWRWIHAAATPVFGPDGAVAYANGIVFDVTGQKRAEESLRESEQKYRRISQEFQALLDGISDALLHIAPDMSILWANSAAAAAMGRDIPSLIGNPCYRMWYGRSSICEGCPVESSFRTGKSERVKKTGSDGKCWGIKTFPIRNESGEVVSVIESAADITALLRLQTEAARTSQLVSLGELAAGVAHEINNPLAGIGLCFRELMHPDIDGESRESLCRVIDAELIRIKNIVDRLLTFSRMTVTSKTPVNLNRLVESILVLCRYQFAAKKIEVVTNFAGDAPDVLVEENKIEQVFINIMLNGLHAMDQGGRLTITTGRHPDCCSIAFEDTGPGIEPDILPRIFDPFFTTRSDRGGTGLGLSISREIVEQHGGKIDVSSSQGSGSRFVVRLPLAAPGMEPRGEEERA